MTHIANYDNSTVINVVNFSIYEYHYDKYKLRVKSAYGHNKQIQYSITMLLEFLLMSVISFYTLHMLTFFLVIQTVIAASTHHIFLMINTLATYTRHMQLSQLSSQ